MTRPTVCVVGFDHVQNLDLTGPWEVFAGASRLLSARGREGYELRLATRDGGPVRTSSGLTLAADLRCDQVGEIDTLVVPGGFGVDAACAQPELVAWIAAAAARSRRVASVCTGAFLLAEAGLLEGRRATTHWARCDELQRRHPTVRVERDPIYVRDGRDVSTSAGVTAGLDLALALVEEDHGPDLALELARWFVMYVRRPGGQNQFSAQLSQQIATRRPIAEVQAWIGEHPEADLGVEALARRAGMSPRNFARAFAREVGATPAAYVRAVRLECARRALEQSDEGVDGVADRCGFGTSETLRRVFQRELGLTPGAYRNRFTSAR